MGIGNQINVPIEWQNEYRFDSGRDNIVEMSFTRERDRNYLYGYSGNTQPDATPEHIRQARNYTKLRDMAAPTTNEALSAELLMGADLGWSGFFASAFPMLHIIEAN